MNPILIQTVKQDLRTLRLRDMAEVLDTALEKAHEQSHLQFLSQLVQHQLAAVNNRSLDRRIKKAQFPHNMRFDAFDWNFQPGLNIEQIKNLQDLSFVANPHPVIILGKTGTGKTHIATALGITACEQGLHVQFYTLQNLLNRLYATLADDTTDDLISSLLRLDLLIIDHVENIRTKPEYPTLLLDLVSSCQDKLAIIITSSISFEEWAQALGNPSITHAIIDRLMHRAQVINIRPGLSYRAQGPYAPNIPRPDQNTDQ
jgi:DNA replication protein DnaC